MARRLGVTVDAGRRRRVRRHQGARGGRAAVAPPPPPDRDTVLYPAISYPTYAMGATLAGCRAVPYDATSTAIDPADAARALCLWVNMPGNPTGELDDLGAAAAWGRAHGVPVLSDECYVEFTWDGPPRTILEHGADGVLAVHSLSKRSNLAGVRAGLLRRRPRRSSATSPRCASTPASWCPGRCRPRPSRRGPTTSTSRSSGRATAAGWRDGRRASAPVGRRRAAARRCLLPVGAGARRRRLGPGPAPGRARAARSCRPGDFYGPAGAGHVRVAVVQPDDRLELVADRLRDGDGGPGRSARSRSRDPVGRRDGRAGSDRRWRRSPSSLTPLVAADRR